MKKRIFAAVLGVAMVAATAVPVAATTTEAGIVFTPGTTITIPQPPGPEFPSNLHSISNLNFWTRAMSATTQTYQSWETADLTRQSAIGLPVETVQNFLVSATLENFYLNGSGVAADLGNAGAHLDLILGGNTLTGSTHVWQSWNSGTNPATVATFPASGANPNRLVAGGTSQQIAQGTNFIAGVPLMWAANFRGELTVHAGTAREGNLQADMVWTIVGQ